MDSAQLLGLALVSLSAVMLAWHWYGWRNWSGSRSDLKNSERLPFRHRQYCRRTQASGLIGLLGLALTTAELVPQRPWPLTIYLLGMVLATCWVIWLAVVDAYDTNQSQRRRQTDEITFKLREQIDISPSDCVKRRD